MTEEAQVPVEPVRGTPARYELSGSYVSGFLHALRALGFSAEILTALPESVREELCHASARHWWPPDAVEAVAMRVLEKHGEPAVDALGHAIAVDSLRGYVNIALALAGGDPVKLLGRIGEFTQASIRGVEVAFRQAGPGKGRIEVRYSGAVRREAGLLWRGAFRRLVSTMHINGGRIGPSEHDGAGIFGYDVTWQ